jgi:hypothetical protein
VAGGQVGIGPAAPRSRAPRAASADPGDRRGRSRKGEIS